MRWLTSGRTLLTRLITSEQPATAYICTSTSTSSSTDKSPISFRRRRGKPVRCWGWQQCAANLVQSMDTHDVKLLFAHDQCRRRPRFAWCWPPEGEQLSDVDKPSARRQDGPEQLRLRAACMHGLVEHASTTAIPHACRQALVLVHVPAPCRAPQLLPSTCVITPRSGSATRRVDVYLSCNALSAAAAADISGAAAAEAVADGPGAETCGCWWWCCCCVRPLAPRAGVCCCCEGPRRPVASPAPDRPKLLCIFQRSRSGAQRSAVAGITTVKGDDKRMDVPLYGGCVAFLSPLFAANAVLLWNLHAET